MNRTSKAAAYGAMAFCNIMWGLSFMFSKHALASGFSTLTLIFFRYSLAALLLTGMVLGKEKRMHLPRKDLLPMFLSSLSGITLYYVLEYAGIQRTTTVNASLIIASVPILTLIVEAVWHRTALTSRQILGSALSVLGVGLIVWQGSNEGTHSLLGDGLILGAAIGWVAYLFLSRRLRDTYSSLAMNAWQALFASLTLLPCALMESPQWQPIPASGWISALVLAIVCSALSHWLYGYALPAMTPLAGAVFTNLLPVATIVAGVLWLDETMTAFKILGAILIIGSIFMINLPESKNNACKTR